MTKASWQIGGEQKEDRPSRSQKKRDSTALQKIGTRLTELPPSKLAEIPLPEDLKKGLEDYARMGSREARRRQLQYIGRLMRETREDGSLQLVLGGWELL